MFHSTNNLFFGKKDGNVRILKLRTAPSDFPKFDTSFPAHDVLLDVTIDAGTWSSIVSLQDERQIDYFFVD
jgi:hypothetical protein